MYAAGFYEGTVYFPPSLAALPDSSIVQGWVAKFSANGTLACAVERAVPASSAHASGVAQGSRR